MGSLVDEFRQKNTAPLATGTSLVDEFRATKTGGSLVDEFRRSKGQPPQSGLSAMRLDAPSQPAVSTSTARETLPLTSLADLAFARPEPKFGEFNRTDLTNRFLQSSALADFERNRELGTPVQRRPRLGTPAQVAQTFADITKPVVDVGRGMISRIEQPRSPFAKDRITKEQAKYETLSKDRRFIALTSRLGLQVPTDIFEFLTQTPAAVLNPPEGQTVGGAAKETGAGVVQMFRDFFPQAAYLAQQAVRGKADLEQFKGRTAFDRPQEKFELGELSEAEEAINRLYESGGASPLYALGIAKGAGKLAYGLGKRAVSGLGKTKFEPSTEPRPPFDEAAAKSETSFEEPIVTRGGPKRSVMINNLRGMRGDAKKAGDFELVERIDSFIRSADPRHFVSTEQIVQLQGEYASIRDMGKSRNFSARGVREREASKYESFINKLTPEERARFEAKQDIGGYDLGESVRAGRARDRGLLPADEISQKLKSEGIKGFEGKRISATFIENRFKPDEWHHTGDKIKSTNFFDYNSIKEIIREKTPTKLPSVETPPIRQKISETKQVMLTKNTKSGLLPHEKAWRITISDTKHSSMRHIPFDDYATARKEFTRVVEQEQFSEVRRTIDDAERLGKTLTDADIASIKNTKPETPVYGRATKTEKLPSVEPVQSFVQKKQQAKVGEAIKKTEAIQKKQKPQNIFATEGRPDVSLTDWQRRDGFWYSKPEGFRTTDPQFIAELDQQALGQIKKTEPLSAKRPVVDKTGSDIVDLVGNKPPLNPDGTLTVYHRTTKQAAAQIKKTGRFLSQEKGDVFVSTKPEGQATGYGDTVVKLKVKPDKTIIDDAFRGGEVHLRISAKDISAKNILPAVGAAAIPTVAALSDYETQDKVAEAAGLFGLLAVGRRGKKTSPRMSWFEAKAGGLTRKEWINIRRGGETLDTPAGKVPISTLPKETGAEVGRTVRWDKYDVSQKDMRKFESFTKDLGLSTRSVRTFEDMKRAAAELGTRPEELLSLKQVGDAESLALRNYINATSKYINNLEKKMAGDPNLASEMAPKIEVADQAIKLGLKKLLPASTEAGRTVVSYRILANGDLTPELWYRRAIKELGDTEQFTPTVRQTIDGFIESSDLNGLAQYVTSLRRADWIEKVMNLRKAGLLTSPVTHTRNVLGNFAFAALESVSNPVSAGMDFMVKHLWTGRRTESFSLGGLKQQTIGLFKEGPKKAWTYIKTGADPYGLMKKWDIHRQVTYEHDIFNKYTQGVYRVLGAGDKIFFEKTLRGSLFEQARVQAMNEGLGMFKPGFKERTLELFKKPTDDMVAIAIDDAFYVTFRKPNALSDLITDFRKKTLRRIREADTPSEKFGARVAYGGVEQFAPFAVTPAAIAKNIFIDYTPIGGIKSLLELPKIKESALAQRRFVQGMGRSVTGTGLMTLGYMLASQDLMTGSLPDKPSERAAWDAQGKTPYSIKIGDQWIQVSSFTGPGNLMAFGADMNDVTKNIKGTGGGALAVGAKAMKQVKSLSPLQGIQQAADLLEDPERQAERLAGSQVGSFVPSIVGQAARMIDPRLTKPSTTIEAIKGRIPGLRQDVPPKRDIFGEEIRIESTVGEQAVSPVYRRTVKNEALMKELEKLDVDISYPSRSIKGIKLTGQEYDEYLAESGKKIKNVAEKAVQSKLNDDAKKRLIERRISDERERARNTLFPQWMKQRYPFLERLPNDRVLQIFTLLNRSDEFRESSDADKEKMIKQKIGQR